MVVLYKQELEADLVLLEKCLNQFSVQQPEDIRQARHKRFADTLRNTHFNHKNALDSASTILLLNYWLKHLEISVEISNPDVYGEGFDKNYDCDEIVELLIKHNLISEYTSDESSRRTVALLCLLRLQSKYQGAHLPIENNVVSLIEQWMGRPVNKQEIETLEHAVNLLYGPAVWSLYRDEVKRERDLPEYLWLNKIPIALAAPSVQVMDVPTNLI